MSAIKAFRELRGNSNLNLREVHQLLSHIEALLHVLGSPGDWGYETKLGELTQILNVEQGELYKAFSSVRVDLNDE